MTPLRCVHMDAPLTEERPLTEPNRGLSRPALPLHDPVTAPFTPTTFPGLPFTFFHLRRSRATHDLEKGGAAATMRPPRELEKEKLVVFLLNFPLLFPHMARHKYELTKDIEVLKCRRVKYSGGRISKSRDRNCFVKVLFGFRVFSVELCKILEMRS